MSLVDNVITVRILYMLTSPFNKWDAFKFGIIDKDGKTLKKLSQLKTTAEQDSFSMLHRFVRKMKLMLAVLPGGKSSLASYAASYMLIKEHMDVLTEDNIEELFADMLNTYEGDVDVPQELLEEINKALNEEMTTTAAIESDVPRIYPKKRGRKVVYKKVGTIAHDLIKKMPKPVNEDWVCNVNGELICEDILPPEAETAPEAPKVPKKTANDHLIPKGYLNSKQLVDAIGKKADKVFRHEWYQKWCHLHYPGVTKFRVTVDPVTSHMAVYSAGSPDTMVRFDYNFSRGKIAAAHLFRKEGEQWIWKKSTNPD